MFVRLTYRSKLPLELGQRARFVRRVPYVRRAPPKQKTGFHEAEQLCAAELQSYRDRPAIFRFLNPWVDLALVTPEKQIGDKVINFTNSWSIVSVLLCGLSSASLMSVPHCDEGDKEKSFKNPSVFASYGILSEEKLHDVYIVACATSFFASGCALGLSIVGSCVAMVTPCYAIRSFVIANSTMLSATPLLNAVAGGLVGAALAVGVDMTQGGQVALLALGSAGLTTVVVTGAALSGQLGLYRVLVAVAKRKKVFSVPR